MKWSRMASGDLEVGGSPVPVRTLRLPDDMGETRRFRVETVSGGGQPATSPGRSGTAGVGSRSRGPAAWGRLGRAPDKRVGVVVTGAYGQMVRVGRGERITALLFVPFSAVSRRVRERLLIPLDYEVCHHGDLFLVRERQERPYYVASSRGSTFHFPGCSRAHRINEGNRMIYQSREEAFRHGRRPGRYCRP